MGNFFGEDGEDDDEDVGRRKVLPFRKKKQSKPEWQDEWQMSESGGTPVCNVTNATIALVNCPEMNGLLKYDEMAKRIVVCYKIPGERTNRAFPRQLDDYDIFAIQEFLQRAGLRRISSNVVQQAVESVAKEHCYHPIREWLTGLVWDGVPRLDAMLSTYFGCQRTDYTDGIGAMFLISMVARIMEPGCKADYMLIFEGKQGTYKSTACRILAGEWFSDSLPDISRADPVRLSMHLRGKWLIEIAELSAFSAAESHRLKDFVTQTEERYTPKYGRNEVVEKRCCVFAATTNEAVYLKDSTGARRFWPVKVGIVDLEALKSDRNQLFAEAMCRYRDGEEWWPSPEFEAEFVHSEQENRTEQDPWFQTVKSYLEKGYSVIDPSGGTYADQEGKPVTYGKIPHTTTGDILTLVLGMETQRITMRDQRRIVAILISLGWTQKRTNQARLYFPPIEEKQYDTRTEPVTVRRW